jgi:hypothetical protein
MAFAVGNDLLLAVHDCDTLLWPVLPGQAVEQTKYVSGHCP